MLAVQNFLTEVIIAAITLVSQPGPKWGTITLMENNGLQPGQTITPGSAPIPKTPEPEPAAVPAPASPAPSSVAAAMPAQPQTAPAPEAPPAQPAAAAAPQETALPQGVPTGLEQPEETNNPNAEEINWTASEFVAHEKSAGWYIGLAMAAAAIAGIVYLITRDLVSVGVVLFGSFMLGVYGARQPRQLEYRLDTRGVSIGPKYYEYSEFRTFSIMPEGAFSSIVFMPLKRFAPTTTIYYDPKDEDNIVNILSNCLPFEEGKHDMVDRLMRRIRF